MKSPLTEQRILGSFLLFAFFNLVVLILLGTSSCRGRRPSASKSVYCSITTGTLVWPFNDPDSCRSSLFASSKSPDHPLAARSTLPKNIPFQHCVSKLMTCLRRDRDALNRSYKRKTWSVKSLSTSLVVCCLSICQSVLLVSQVTKAIHRTVPPLFRLVTLNKCDRSSLLSLFGRLCLPLRSFLSDEVSSCHGSTEPLDTLSRTLSNWP